ncbi:MAG: apolipoprotein N-acyltransferase, partial [Planctomycetota bacterium]
WVAGEYLQAHLISGFPWFFLSQTQYGQVWLIQIADAAGQYGVSFYVALVNGLAAGLWITWSQRGRGRNNILPAIRQNVVGLAVAGLLLTGMVGYSLFRLSQPRGPKAGPVAVVQQAFPIALGRQGTSDVEAFKAHVAATEQLAALAESRGSRIQWILWPETMLPRGLNLDFVSGLSPDGSVELESDRARDFTRQNFGTETLEAREIYARLLENSRLYLDRIDRMVRDIDAPLLGGGGSLHWEPELGGERTPWLSRNSVMLFVPGLGQTQLYSKIQLVPFSEYVPFRQSAPGVHTWLRGFVPPVMTQLFPGQIATVFRIQTDQGPLRVAAPVCYEGTFARICRRLVWQEGGKAVDVIANVSNDGWFVWPGTNRGSTEQAQHLSHYVYRAIETRVPVVRAVNTGISASIDSNGRIVARVVRDGQEVMVTGGLLLDGAGPTGQDGLVAGPQILLDRRATLYSLVGDMFAQAVSLAVGIWTAVLLVARFRSSRRKAPPGTIKEGRPDGKIQ